MDHGFQREMEPWEMSDGCVFLAQELSVVRCKDDESVSKNAVKLI